MKKMTPEERAEFLALFRKASRQCEEILETIQDVKSDINRIEAEQSIPFALHYKSALIESGVAPQAN